MLEAAILAIWLCSERFTLTLQVALQHEFTQLGLMKLIEEFCDAEAPDLREQLEAYHDNFVNVSDLVSSSALLVNACVIFYGKVELSYSNIFVFEEHEAP